MMRKRYSKMVRRNQKAHLLNLRKERSQRMKVMKSRLRKNPRRIAKKVKVRERMLHQYRPPKAVHLQQVE
jgi:hypothetical protein